VVRVIDGICDDDDDDDKGGGGGGRRRRGNTGGSGGSGGDVVPQLQGWVCTSLSFGLYVYTSGARACLSVCVRFDAKYRENTGDRGLITIGSL